MASHPLTGKRILITRAREQSGEFAVRLRKLGAEVIEFPTIEILPPLSWESLDRAIDRLAFYDWIVFTSANGAFFFWQRLGEKLVPPRLPPTLKVCAIGPATARGLKEKGIRVDYMPREFVAEAILRGFGAMGIQGKRVLLARVRMTRDVLPEGLRKMGALVDMAEVYRTVKPRGGSRRLKRILADGRVDVITFTSSSTVSHFSELLQGEDLKRTLMKMVIACIGPVTAKTAQNLGMAVHIQPKEYTIPALGQAIVDYFSPVNQERQFTADTQKPKGNQTG